MRPEGAEERLMDQRDLPVGGYKKVVTLSEILSWERRRIAGPVAGVPPTAGKMPALPGALRKGDREKVYQLIRRYDSSV